MGSSAAGEGLHHELPTDIQPADKRFPLHIDDEADDCLKRSGGVPVFQSHVRALRKIFLPGAAREIPRDRVVVSHWRDVVRTG